MPSAPELGYVTREIGIVEVAHEFDAEEFSGSDSNVRITGEIAVDLESKKNRSKKQRRAGLGVISSPNLIYVRRAVIGYYNLFE